MLFVNQGTDPVTNNGDQFINIQYDKVCTDTYSQTNEKVT